MTNPDLHYLDHLEGWHVGPGRQPADCSRCRLSGGMPSLGDPAAVEYATGLPYDEVRALAEAELLERCRAVEGELLDLIGI